MGEENFLPIDTSMPGIVTYRFPSDYFSQERAPQDAIKIADEIMRHPERFGSEKIKSAADYLREYRSDLGGMVKLENRELREKREGFDEIYDIQLTRSAYDNKVFKGFGIWFEGIVPTQDIHIGVPLVDYMHRKQDSDLCSPVIWVQPEQKVSFDRECFENNWLRFGIRLDNSSVRRDLALGKHFRLVNPELSDALVWKSESYLGSKPIAGGVVGNVQNFDFTEDADPSITFANEDQAERLRVYPEERVLSYLCIGRYDGKNLSLLNKGLDPMPLFIRKIKREIDLPKKF